MLGLKLNHVSKRGYWTLYLLVLFIYTTILNVKGHNPRNYGAPYNSVVIHNHSWSSINHDGAPQFIWSSIIKKTVVLYNWIVELHNLGCCPLRHFIQLSKRKTNLYSAKISPHDFWFLASVFNLHFWCYFSSILLSPTSGRNRNRRGTKIAIRAGDWM